MSQPRSRRLVPHSWWGRLIAALTAAAVVFATICVVIYAVVFPHSAPAALRLQPTTVSSASASAAASDTTSVAGAWSVVGSSSTVGYRVREQLGNLPAPDDAVGRTHEVSGSLTLTQTSSSISLTQAHLVANVESLTSDNSLRDTRIQQIGLQSAQYPTATFTLTSPIVLPRTSGDGAVSSVTLVGDLTLHGETKSVSIRAQAQLTSGDVQVAGSLTFPFSEFGMQIPSFGGFVTILGNATLEFDVAFAHSA